MNTVRPGEATASLQLWSTKPNGVAIYGTRAGLRALAAEITRASERATLVDESGEPMHKAIFQCMSGQADAFESLIDQASSLTIYAVAPFNVLPLPLPRKRWSLLAQVALVVGAAACCMLLLAAALGLRVMLGWL
jgi:hypothetical protein